MSLETLPENYLLFTTSGTKNPSIVVSIPGLDLFSNRTVYTKIKFGDAGLAYGTPYAGGGVPVYGQLKPVANCRDILALDKSSLTISQRLEPELGKASISMLTLSFIDSDGYMSKAIAPGVLIPEIMGAEVMVYLGWEEVSYPDDFFVIFRGTVSSVETLPGLVTLQLSDPNIARRKQVFYSAQTSLASAVLTADTTIPLVSNGDFHVPILGPDGSYDPGVKTYVKVEDEFIEYTPSGIGLNTYTGVTRGARGTAAADHDIDASAQAAIQLQDHVIDMALKLQLSGWGGPWISGVAIQSIVTTLDSVLLSQAGSFTLPVGVNAIRDYGLVVGDYVTISGASNPANNGTFQITKFGDVAGESNRLIYTTGELVLEYPTSATVAFRSQFDVYPVTCGAQLTPKQVDVQGHIDLKNTYLSGGGNTFQFLLTEPTAAKSFIEDELFKPTSLYSLTKNGRLSVGITKPPLASKNLQFLTKDNILNAQQIKTTRALNNRKFFNEIDYYFDVDDAGDFTNTLAVIDSDSLARIGVLSVLPIKSLGAKSSLGVNFLNKALFFLSRYKNGAIQMDVKVNWGVGALIEAGDIVAVQDEGDLQIPNPETGERNLGTQLFEVVDRSLDLRNGQVTLKLINGVGAQSTDRYGTISPSSKLGSGSTTSVLNIVDSYGAIFPGNEGDKWSDYAGLPIWVHSFDWSASEQTTLQGVNPLNNHQLVVNPPLSFTPPAGYIVDIADYPSSTDKLENSAYKTIHAFLDATVPVASGSSPTAFTVGAGDIGKFFAGGVIRVHTASYSQDSGDVTILSVNTSTNTITTKTALGFTPAAGMLIDLIGFADGGGPYRWI